MPSYNLMKRESRNQLRRDRQEELKAVEQKRWPRDTNDAMRWLHCPKSEDPAEYAGRMCRFEIEALNTLERSLSMNDPSLEGWER